MTCRKVRGIRIPVAWTFTDIFSELSKREGSEAESNIWLLKISHDSAVRDLRILVEILDMIKKQEKPRKRTVPPILAAW